MIVQLRNFCPEVQKNTFLCVEPQPVLSGDVEHFLQTGHVVFGLGAFDHNVIDIGLYNILNQPMKDLIYHPLISCPNIFQSEWHGCETVSRNQC